MTFDDVKALIEEAEASFAQCAKSAEGMPPLTEEEQAAGLTDDCPACTFEKKLVEALKFVIELMHEEADKALSATVYCHHCGSCGIPECCEAPRCAYFDVYAKDIAGQFRDVVEDRDFWKKQALSIRGLAEAVMNIPCDPKGYGSQAPYGDVFYKGYAFGHLDARKAAASILNGEAQ